MSGKLLDRKQLFTLLIIAGMIAGLPLLIFLSKNRQKIRSRATGTGEITVSLIPSSSLLQKSSSLTVTVDLTNIRSTVKTINVAGVDLRYDPNFFTISNLSCGNILSAAAKNEIAANAVYLTCFIPGGTSAFSLDSGATITLGSFDLSPQKNAAPNTASRVNFLRTNIPDTLTGMDASDGGTGGEYTIVFSSHCSRKTQGDANCDDLVDLVDFELWRREFTGTVATNRANFNPATDNVVDLADFELWRRTYTRDGGR